MESEYNDKQIYCFIYMQKLIEILYYFKFINYICYLCEFFMFYILDIGFDIENLLLVIYKDYLILFIN